MVPYLKISSFLNLSKPNRWNTTSVVYSIKLLEYISPL